MLSCHSIQRWPKRGAVWANSLSLVLAAAVSVCMPLNSFGQESLPPAPQPQNSPTADSPAQLAPAQLAPTQDAALPSSVATDVGTAGAGLDEPAAGDDFRSAVAEPSPEKLLQQISHLNSPSYRTRQLAIWYLSQNAALALPLLRDAGRTTDLNIGAEVVALLSAQAMLPDPVLSVAAHEALQEIAGGKQSVTAVSYFANSALDGIANRQELLAQRSLEDLNVQLGLLRLTIGGTKQNEIRMLNPSNIVHVTSEFSGSEKDIRLFRFLRSYDTAYLEGDKITAPLLREVIAMPRLKRVVLKGPSITNDLLTTLFDLSTLEHLELSYANVDDGAIDTIVDLPLVDSLRIFGTRITQEGSLRVKSELDGLDIYFGRGGFLGVQTSQNDLMVSKVVPGSGADNGGIEQFDLITHVNDKPIKTFAQLREELANFAVDEIVSVSVKRAIGTRIPAGLQAQEIETSDLKLQVKLGLQDTD